MANGEGNNKGNMGTEKVLQLLSIGVIILNFLGMLYVGVFKPQGNIIDLRSEIKIINNNIENIKEDLLAVKNDIREIRRK